MLHPENYFILLSQFYKHESYDAMMGDEYFTVSVTSEVHFDVH